MREHCAGAWEHTDRRPAAFPRDANVHEKALALCLHLIASCSNHSRVSLAGYLMRHRLVPLAVSASRTARMIHG